jgi:hypothetical protein
MAQIWAKNNREKGLKAGERELIQYVQLNFHNCIFLSYCFLTKKRPILYTFTHIQLVYYYTSLEDEV